MNNPNRPLWQRTVEWAILLAGLAALSFAVASLFTGCAAATQQQGAGGDPVIPFYLWLPGFGWVFLWNSAPLTPEQIGSAAPWYQALVSTWWPAATPLLALFPKVRDALGASVAPETPLLERAVALASPALPFLHSPPSVQKKKAARLQVKKDRLNVAAPGA